MPLMTMMLAAAMTVARPELSNATPVSALLGASGAALQNEPLQPRGVRSQASPLRRQGEESKGVVRLSVDEGLRASLVGASRVNLHEVPLPGGQSVQLVLERLEPFAANARVIGSSRQRNGRVVDRALPPVQLDCFAGTVAGEPESRVFISLWSGGAAGWVERGGQRFILSSGRPGAATAPVIFDPQMLPPEERPDLSFECHHDLLPENAIPETGGGGLAGGPPPCRRVHLALETDHEFLLMFGSSEVYAQAYVGTLFASVTEIYRVDLNTTFVIDFLRFWETPEDPWNQGSTQSQLYQFRDYWEANMEDLPRDLAHFLSGRNLGGGVAFLNGLCDTTNDDYGLSANLTGYFPVPLEIDGASQNWDIMVVSHELGHNFGSPHTHNYDPPLDGCGLGDCSDAINGTIMSYCHQCSPGMSNMNLYFHPENVATMLAFLDSTCDLVTDEQYPVAYDDFVSTSTLQPLTIDVLANDIAQNCIEIEGEIDVFDATSEQGGIVQVSQGTGPGGRDQLLYTPPAQLGGVDTFAYQATGFGQSSVATVHISFESYRPADAPATVLPGLRVSYYNLAGLNATVIPDFDAMEPFSVQFVDEVFYPSTDGPFAGSGLADDVGARYEGFIDIPADDIYALLLTSDDGSRLYIGDQLVVDNDGLHGMVQKSGSIGLAAGLHKLRIDFFERTGGAGLVARIAGGEIQKQVIPGFMLFYAPKIVGDLDEDGDVDGADLGLLLGSWGVVALGGDLDGDDRVDGADLGILLGNWTG